MCPTPIGRVHTRVATIFGPALLGLILWLITGNIGFLVIIGIFLLLGIFLDSAIYPWMLKYQPPYMTGVLALAELGLLLVLVGILQESTGRNLDVSILEAIIFYWASFILAIGTKIVLLPIISLTYLESAGEFRRIEWAVPPSQVAVPVLASAADAQRGAGGIVREASGVHAKPLPPLPSPSGVHAIPQSPSG